MPFFPPGARQETISTYEKACRPVLWREERNKAKDGTDLALCVGDLPSSNKLEENGKIPHRRITVLYFQGNAGSIPSRLPYLSDILRQLQRDPTIPSNIIYNIVALSYRGYWTSRGRATQRGIILDAEAALRHVSSTSQTSAQVVLWGQSVGAGVACEALAKHLQGIEVGSDGLGYNHLEVSGLILETPFTSVKDMLVAIYPQRWLPYRYLYPFLRNKWDSMSALKSIATNFQRARHRLPRPNPTHSPESGSETPATNSLKVLIVQAGNDELVPCDHIDKLEELCRTLGMDVRRTVVPGALHAECMIRARGRDAIVEFLRSAEDQPK
ncbi:MAG: hypothetical protein M1824_000899 [Vezdaea acicularis]|nr:MAG: hypothetical protein M1824_000899 [Vezdaea acicularis]